MGFAAAQPFASQPCKSSRASSLQGQPILLPASGSACSFAEAIMRALVEVGPVVAYMFVLPPFNPLSFYFYDSQFGERAAFCAPPIRRTCPCPACFHLLLRTDMHESNDRTNSYAGSYPASACAAANPKNDINHAVVRAPERAP